MNGPHATGAGRPSVSARYAAERRLSRHQTIVWFSATDTTSTLPRLRAQQVSDLAQQDDVLGRLLRFLAGGAATGSVRVVHLDDAEQHEADEHERDESGDERADEDLALADGDHVRERRLA